MTVLILEEWTIWRSLYKIFTSGHVSQIIVARFFWHFYMCNLYVAWFSQGPLHYFNHLPPQSPILFHLGNKLDCLSTATCCFLILSFCSVLVWVGFSRCIINWSFILDEYTTNILCRDSYLVALQFSTLKTCRWSNYKL